MVYRDCFPFFKGQIIREELCKVTPTFTHLMGSQVGARRGLATLTISTRKIWYNWTIPPNQFLGEIRNKKKIRHCGKKQIFFFISFWYRRLWATRAISRNLWFRSEKSTSFANFIGFWFFWSPRPELSIQSPFNLFFFLRFTGNGFLSDDPMYFRFFLRTPSYLTEMDSARAKKKKNWFQILFQIEAEFEKILLKFDIFGGIMAQWLAYFLPNPVAPGSVPSIPKIILGGKKCHCSWG